MEVKIDKNDLLRVLQNVQGIVERKTTMPILVNVLLSAAEGSLKASATDLDIAIVNKAKAKVLKPGSTTVNAKVFYDVVKELPEGETTLVLSEGERLEVGVGKSMTRIIGVSSEEYPGLPGINLEIKGKILSDQLDEMISKTIYAVSMDESRFNLSGVCFDIIVEGKKRNLRLVATDGHRLAIITRPIEGKLDFEGNALVPRKGLVEIKRLIEGDSRLVGFEFVEGFLLVESEETKLAVRLIDGEFPEYRNVIPKNPGVAAKVTSGMLAKALKRASLMVTDKSKGVQLDFLKDSIAISSSSPELGDAREVIECDFAGDPVSIGFNARYVLEMAQSLSESTEMIIEVSGELGAAKLYAANDESYIGIVMPMRLQS